MGIEFAYETNCGIRKKNVVLGVSSKPYIVIDNRRNPLRIESIDIDTSQKRIVSMKFSDGITITNNKESNGFLIFIVMVIAFLLGLFIQKVIDPINIVKQKLLIKK